MQERDHYNRFVTNTNEGSCKMPLHLQSTPASIRGNSRITIRGYYNLISIDRDVILAETRCRRYGTGHPTLLNLLV